MLEGAADGLLADGLVEFGFAGDAVGILGTALLRELKSVEGGEEDTGGICRGGADIREEFWRENDAEVGSCGTDNGAAMSSDIA